MKYPMINNLVYNTPWLIHPDWMATIDSVISARLDGERASQEQKDAAVSQQPEQVASPGSIAVLPLFGIMTQHAGMMSEYSGGTSTATFGKTFRSVMNDPHISRVIIHAHTPGGETYGTQELSDLIYSYRGTKPVQTVVSSLMASAGVWAGSATDEVIITPGGEIGSVGVVRIHTDVSKAEEKRGIKTTLIATPPGKIRGNSLEPLNEEAVAEAKESIQETYGRFVDSLARNYGVSTKHVRDNFGQGGMLKAKQAVEAGMAHRIATLDQVIAEGAKRRRSSGSVRAANLLRLAEAE